MLGTPDTKNRIRVSFEGSCSSVSRLTATRWAVLEQSDNRRHAHECGQPTHAGTDRDRVVMGGSRFSDRAHEVTVWSG